jgi:hypothetical protein
VTTVQLIVLGGIVALVLQRVVPAQWPYRRAVMLALVVIAVLAWAVLADKAFAAEGMPDG